MPTAYQELLARLHSRLPEVEYELYSVLLCKVVLEAQMQGYTQARMIVRPLPTIRLKDAQDAP